jgi:FkbM family methyltransferase
MSIVQIGANDGKFGDPIYQFVMRNRHATKILLIEPQAELIPFLKENYSRHPSASFCNCAIGPAESIVLYRVKPEMLGNFKPRYMKDAPAYRVPSGFASQSLEHVTRHAEGSFEDGIKSSDYLQQITVHARALSSFRTEMPWIGNLDLLQVDVEGADDMVIFSSNIEELRPNLINFEYKNLVAERARKLNEYLVGNHYHVRRWSDSDAVAIKSVSQDR